jgi:hypothetical protein
MKKDNKNRIPRKQLETAFTGKTGQDKGTKMHTFARERIKRNNYVCLIYVHVMDKLKEVYSTSKMRHV